ncbi:MAG: aminopeptidase P family protein [Victivallales bacterium]|nr:aminopeptidase P family protein [Victivallales bacterium]
MASKLIFAKSSSCADMLYATGFLAFDPFLYFETEKEKGVIVSSLEFGRASKEARKGIKVYEPRDLFGRRADRVSIATLIQKLDRLFPKNSWCVPADFPLNIGLQLKRRKIKISPARKPLFPERTRKSIQEVAAIKAALSISEAAMAKAMQIIVDSIVSRDGTLIRNKAPLTSEKIKFEISMVLLEAGAHAESTIVACGGQAADPHNSGSGPIRAGQPIVIDIFPRLLDPRDPAIPSGYWGDITRTFVKGKAPYRLRKAYDAVKEARDRAKDFIKPGVSGAEAFRIAADTLEKHGFKTEKVNGVNQGFFHGLGHGVGLDIHEPPALSLRNPHPLEQGNIVTVEPGLYYPDLGGIRLEDMVLVQKNSSLTLNSFQDHFEID